MTARARLPLAQSGAAGVRRTALFALLGLLIPVVANSAAPVPAARTGTAEARPTLAISMDDLPAHATLPPGVTRIGVAQRIIGAFKAAGVVDVHGFINGASIEREPGSDAVLAAWRKAGFTLGNHGWSHANLDTLSVAGFATEVERNERLLAAAGGDWHWFRYPFIAEGSDPAKRDAARLYLAARGYRIAAVTMSFGDYAWNEPYARCVARHDDAGIARLETTFLAAADGEVARARLMAHRLYGRDIPLVLLLHIGAFDARMMPRLLALYQVRGFSFTSLPAAERDPAYREDTDPRLPYRPASLEARLDARHLPVPAGGFTLSTLDAICR